MVVYSARNEQLIKPLFDAYTKETGVKIKFITDKEGALLQRLKAEGENTPADMLITVDAGNLWQAAREGSAQAGAVESADRQYPGPPARPRQPVVRPVGARPHHFLQHQKVKPAELSTYEDLGSPKWKGRLCLRTSKKVYNQSLVAMMIAEHGEAKTEQIVKSWVANLATDPFPDDTKMLEAIAAGQCDVGIANTYYFGRLIEKKPDLPLAIFWPNQKEQRRACQRFRRRRHQHAKHEKEAVKAAGMAVLRQGAEPVRRRQPGIPGQPDSQAGSRSWRPGAVQAESDQRAKAGELQANGRKIDGSRRV